MRRAPPPAFHTLAKDISLNRGATHFTLELSHPSYYKLACAPLQNYTVALLILYSVISRLALSAQVINESLSDLLIVTTSF